MTGFPIGLTVLIIISVLIFFGLAHRVLDRLHLSDKTALVIIVAMAIGSFIDIPLGARASLNVGGGLIPIGLAIYVLSRAGTSREWGRGVFAAVVTAGALYGANRLIGPDPETMAIDPLYVYPLIAGLVAYLIGRSRRTAFVAATLGVVLLDIGLLVWQTRTGTPGTVALGGAGAFDTIVLAGVIAVLLAELIGETRERLQGGPAETGRPRALLENLRGSSLRAKLKPVPEKKPMFSTTESVNKPVEKDNDQDQKGRSTLAQNDNPNDRRDSGV
jgi:uncharacterized membrane protein